ncbi:MAG: hypothetical protein ACFFDP_09870 [Promethearchaeota archaeon]
MKHSTRYGTLFFAGVADIIVGIYIFALVIITSINVMQFFCLIAAGFLTLLTGFYLIYRTLPAVLSIRRGESASILVDERTVQIFNQAARNAFVFLLFALLSATALLSALPKIGHMPTWNESVVVIMVAWVVGIIIFYGSGIYYHRKQKN